MFRPSAIDHPELFFGIVAPIGVEIALPIRALTESLQAKQYDVAHIKLSSIIRRIATIRGHTELVESPRLRRVDSYIKYGNALRAELGGDILAALCLSEIVDFRTSRNNNGGSARKAYIVDQLKTELELDLLRKIYGDLFFQISIYSAREIRVDNLAKVISHDEKSVDRNKFRADAESLVSRDEDEDEPYGQKVGSIFQKADFIISADQADERFSLERQVKRFVELLFGSNSFSPSRAEYGMFAAHAAALRSLDLSRQVGAAIFRDSGEIATLGTNEVPRGGGGTYWSDDDVDAREFRLGIDSNDLRKDKLLQEIVEIILGTSPVLDDKTTSALRESQFMDALEYGRIVHAEMCAITAAARLGIPLAGATLYCTTFPCHMCSKHIVSSGIARVVFLEPYPKSLTADLHSDSVRIEGYSRGTFGSFPHVEFTPFFGITPTRYKDLFARKKRKSAGAFVAFQHGEPKPVTSVMVQSYIVIEKAVMKSIVERIG